MAEIVEHRKFVCVEFDQTNNNKKWNITLYDNDDIMVEWGRVGKKTQSKIHLGVGRRKFESLMRGKTKLSNPPDKRYTENKTIDCGTNGAIPISGKHLESIAKKQIRTKSTIVQRLIEELVKVNAHNILQATGGSITYDESTAQFSTPQGIIIPEQVQEARDILSVIGDIVYNETWTDNRFNESVNKYLRLIPHDVGMRKIIPMELFCNPDVVKKENDILDGLETSFVDISNRPKQIDSISQREPIVFDVELNWLEDDNEVRRIKKKYRDTKKTGHVSRHLDVKNIYTVSIASMRKSFEEVKNKIGNVMELWHGSSQANLLSILKSGLKITPPNTAKITGKMFGGNSIYFASSSTKSLNYSYGYWSGTRNNRCFLFLSFVAMGKSYVPKRSWEDLPKRGYDSTWAKAGVSGVINDEMVIYNNNQCNLTYLIEFG